MMLELDAVETGSTIAGRRCCAASKGFNLYHRPVIDGGVLAHHTIRSKKNSNLKSYIGYIGVLRYGSDNSKGWIRN